MMESNSNELKKLKLDRAAMLQKVQSLEQLIPGISAGVSLSRSSPLISELTGYSSGETEIDMWSFKGSLDLRLTLTTGIPLEEKIQLIQLQLIDLEISAQVKKEKAALQKLYYEIQAGLKNIALLEETLNLDKDRLVAMESQFKKGLRSELELLSARIAVARDMPDLQKAKSEQEKRWITLREYINTVDSIPIELTSPAIETFQAVPDMEVLIRGLLTNENLLNAELDLILAGLNKGLSRKDLFDPELGINLGWSSQVDPLFDKESWYSDEWSDSLNLSFSLSVPLDSRIKGSSGQLEMRTKEDLLQKSRWDRDNIERQLKGQLKSLLLDIELSQNNIELGQLNISLQQQNSEKVRQNFENGRVSLSDLYESRQEFQSSLLALETEKRNLIFLFIELEQLTDYSTLRE
jgi:outer membrane protein TolC